MAKLCFNCGKKLAFNDSFVFEKKPICGHCLKILDKPKMPDAQRMVKDDYSFKIVIGIILFVGGIATSVITYLLAAPGETYYITYGAVIAGFYYFFVGYDRWARYTGRRPPKN